MLNKAKRQPLKKLTLKRETVRSLTAGELSYVAGGGTVTCAPTGAPCGQQRK